MNLLLDKLQKFWKKKFSDNELWKESINFEQSMTYAVPMTRQKQTNERRKTFLDRIVIDDVR